jgi:hypothetical protein
MLEDPWFEAGLVVNRPHGDRQAWVSSTQTSSGKLVSANPVLF